jgi:hypothetical protein
VAVVWRNAVLALGLCFVAAAHEAQAQGAGKIEVEVLVSHISEAPGDVDPRARKLHQRLTKEFRYQSLEVLESRELRLGLDEVGRVALPNGKQLRVRPLQVDAGSALLAVDVEGTLRTDLRVRNGHLVVIGAERYRDGKLVISLEPRW